MTNHTQRCPVCGAMSARWVQWGDEFVWVCSHGCDLTNYVDCEGCGELFASADHQSSHCSECQDEVETAEYPVIRG
jgi:hypothetical protein